MSPAVIANAFRDLVKITLDYPDWMLKSLSETVTPADFQELIRRVDNLLFAKEGSFARSIKEGGRAAETWSPLSEQYESWKEWKKETGEPIKGERYAPREVVSVELWIRTGKTLEFTQSKGNARFKKIAIYPDRFWTGDVFYEVYVKGLDYVRYANQQRPLFVFTSEDETGLNKIIGEWMTNMIAKHFNQVQEKVNRA